jgi:small nuclear ribonucleoprotein (snRNP)-like protein
MTEENETKIAAVVEKVIDKMVRITITDERTYIGKYNDF